MRMFPFTLALLLFPQGSWTAPLAPLSPKDPAPVPAQSEVSAIKSPIKLTLSVYKTIITLRDDFKIETDVERFKKENPPRNGEYDWTKSVLPKYDRRIPTKIGEPIWIKLRIANVGKKPVFIKDDLFTGPKSFGEVIGEKQRYTGVKVTITGPYGTDVPPDDWGLSCSGQTSKIDPEGTAKAALWRNEGKTKEEIEELLNKELRDEEEKKRRRAESHHPIKWLNPGEAVSTGAWFKVRCGGEKNLQVRQIGDFAELWNYHLDAPGVYKIKAVYFNDPYGQGGETIRLETPEIKITVRP
jgi:hypothetical protein